MASDKTHTPYPGLPLNLEDDFRLVEIQPGKHTDVICCNLFSTRIRDTPKYEALSYTWGNPVDKQLIQCKDAAGDGTGRLFVTPNCAAALRRLRLENCARTVWIDSICIDQTEVTERNHQLGLMAQIYTQAEQVVIYLGESSDDSDAAMDCIRQIDDPDYGDESPYTTSRYRVLRSKRALWPTKGASSLGATTRIIRPDTQMLESLLSRPWFNRIWVLQEAALSKSAVVYCGQKTISWDAFKHFKQFNTSEKWVEHLPHVIGRRHITADDSVAVEFQVLRELLQARHCESTDPRDKVYALLPLLSHFSTNPDIVPNYSHSATRVFTDVATYLIRCIGLELLCAVCGRSEFTDLPSWVPDWSIRTRRPILGLNENMRYWSEFRHFRAGGEFVIPSPSNGQGVPSFTIDRVNDDGSFSAHLKTQALRLGKITGIGDPCADDADIPPLRQWKEIASTVVPTADIPRLREWKEHVSTILPVAGTSQEAQAQSQSQAQEPKGRSSSGARLVNFAYNIHAKLRPPVRNPPKATKSLPMFFESRVSTLSINDADSPRVGDLFEYTIITGNVRYAKDIREAVEMFITDDGSESSKIPIRKWMKGLPASFRREVEKIVESCRGRRLFVTDTEYMGLAPLEALSGDVVYIIPGSSVPFIFREENDGLRLVGECYVQNVMDGEMITELDADRLENIVIL